MAAFTEKLKALIGIEDEDDFGEGIEESEYVSRKPSEPSSYGLNGSRSFGSYEQKSRRQVYSEPIARAGMTTDKDNVVAMNQNNETLRVLTQRFKIVVVEPKNLDECPKLVENLKSRKPVIINFEHIEDYIARSIFNFMNGATCALSGKVQGISNNIFVFLPENVDVQANSEHRGITFGVEDGNPWKL